MQTSHPKPVLIVSEIFRSIQGEGPKVGTPSVFLRLGLCNLRCAWCDTAYTWKKGEADYHERSLDRVIKSIAALRKGKNISNLVITGGEPMLQQETLAKLLADPLFADMEIEFETNGSQPLLSALKALKNKISFNISPKLADSGNKPYPVHFYPHSGLKFVYVGKKSEKLIDAFLKKYQNQTREIPVFIMPEGVSAEAIMAKYADALNFCLKKGFRLSPRLQIHLFGHKRAT